MKPITRTRWVRLTCKVCKKTYAVERTRSVPRSTCSQDCRSKLAVASGAGQNKREELIPLEEIWKRAAFIRLNGIGHSGQWW